MKNKMKLTAYAFLILSLTAIDQYTKSLVLAYLELGKSIEILPGFFSLTYVQNYGAGFSILQNATVFFYIITPVCLLLFGFLLYRSKSNLEKAGLILMMSGTIGNFIDRLFQTFVTDFLDFIIFGYDFPVFNFADICLTIGTVLFIIALIREEKCQSSD